MAATVSGYSAAKFMVELNGEAVGFVDAVEGGEPFATVAHDPPGAAAFVGKHLGDTGIEPLRLSFGAGMEASFYEWVAQFTLGQRERRDGAIVFADYGGVVKSRLEFTNALIGELSLPVLDGASSASGRFGLTIWPEKVSRRTNAAGGHLPPSKSGKPEHWVVSNFRLQIHGVNTSKVSRIQPISITQAITLSPGPGGGLQAAAIDAPDLTFTMASDSAQGVEDWFDDAVGRRLPDQERSGRLELLDPTLTLPLFAIDLAGLGIFRLRHQRQESGASVIPRVSVQAYCGRMTFAAQLHALAVALPPPPPPAPVGLAPAGHALWGVALDPAAIARRLRATVPVTIGAPLPSPRRRGQLLGRQWASEAASLDELRAVAALADEDWSAVRLTTGHSLLSRLDEIGHIASNPLELERDDFVEGLVKGAAEVLASASLDPHEERGIEVGAVSSGEAEAGNHGWDASALSPEGADLYVSPERRIAKLEAEALRLKERLARLEDWMSRHEHDVVSLSVGFIRELVNGRSLGLAVNPRGTTRRTGPPVVDN